MLAVDATGSNSTIGATARPTGSPWIVGPTIDLLLIIAAPLVVFAALSAARLVWTATQITSFALVWAIGHHLPGMMRAYGDRRLFQRFRVRFLVAPVLLAAVGVYSAVTRSSAIPFGVGLWGLWHYLMQTYGFVRIYDGKAGSVAPLTCQLDQAMCLAWFIAGVVLTDNGLFSYLNLFYKAGGPVISGALVASAKSMVLILTVMITAAFAANAIWQAVRGSPPSPLKLALMATTFGYYWYCLASASNLLISYALFELFHDAQYLTIVWSFNERRAARDLVAGTFTRFLFRRRRWLIGAYLGLILVYGVLNLGTRLLDDSSLQRALLGLFVASTLLHYYYDGFIWKLRETETRQPLGLAERAAGGPPRRTRPAVAGALAGLLLAGVSWLAWRETGGREFDSAKQDSLVSLLPRSVFAHHNRGRALATAGNLQEAASEYRIAIALNPHYPDVHYHFGAVLMQLAEHDAAAREFRAAVALDPRHVEANYNLGVLLSGRGQFREAISYFEAARQGAPQRAEISASLGATLSSAGRRREAISALSQALQLQPDLVEAHGNLAVALAADGRAEAALAHYRRAVELRADAPTLHYNLAIFLETRGQLAPAEAAYRAALRLDPRAGKIWNNLGVVLAKQSRIGEAADAFRQAVEFSPDDAAARQNLQRAVSLRSAPNSPRP
jgi:Flp pilus assembly protein TadD